MDSDEEYFFNNKDAQLTARLYEGHPRYIPDDELEQLSPRMTNQYGPYIDLSGRPVPPTGAQNPDDFDLFPSQPTQPQLPPDQHGYVGFSPHSVQVGGDRAYIMDTIRAYMFNVRPMTALTDREVMLLKNTHVVSHLLAEHTSLYDISQAVKTNTRVSTSPFPTVMKISKASKKFRRTDEGQAASMIADLLNSGDMSDHVVTVIAIASFGATPDEAMGSLLTNENGMPVEVQPQEHNLRTVANLGSGSSQTGAVSMLIYDITNIRGTDTILAIQSAAAMVGREGYTYLRFLPIVSQVWMDKTYNEVDDHRQVQREDFFSFSGASLGLSVASVLSGASCPWLYMTGHAAGPLRGGAYDFLNGAEVEVTRKQMIDRARNLQEVIYASVGPGATPDDDAIMPDHLVTKLRYILEIGLPVVVPHKGIFAMSGYAIERIIELMKSEDHQIPNVALASVNISQLLYTLRNNCVTSWQTLPSSMKRLGPMNTHSNVIFLVSTLTEAYSVPEFVKTNVQIFQPEDWNAYLEYSLLKTQGRLFAMYKKARQNRQYALMLKRGQYDQYFATKDQKHVERVAKTTKRQEEKLASGAERRSKKLLASRSFADIKREILNSPGWSTANAVGKALGLPASMPDKLLNYPMKLWVASGARPSSLISYFERIVREGQNQDNNESYLKLVEKLRRPAWYNAMSNMPEVLKKRFADLDKTRDDGAAERLSASRTKTARRVKLGYQPPSLGVESTTEEASRRKSAALREQIKDLKRAKREETLKKYRAANPTKGPAFNVPRAALMYPQSQQQASQFEVVPQGGQLVDDYDMDELFQTPPTQSQQQTASTQPFPSQSASEYMQEMQSQSQSQRTPRVPPLRTSQGGNLKGIGTNVRQSTSQEDRRKAASAAARDRKLDIERGILPRPLGPPPAVGDLSFMESDYGPREGVE